MLGLRFFVCGGCDTVVASPDEPPWCDSCGDGSLEEITHELHADTFYTPFKLFRFESLAPVTVGR